jgi:predicted alpha/beta superfamily hydrolase
MIESFNFQSQILNETRDVYIYLPEFYSDEFEGGYPVLYMMDGQNIFSNENMDRPSWDLDITADRLIRQGVIEPIIIVGVAHGLDRDDEYTPTFDFNENTGGYADVYLEFLIQELMPRIMSEFNISDEVQDTSICGSSLGGLFSIYAMMEHNDVFGKIGAVSPSLWWDDKVIFDMAAEWHPEPPLPVFWLDMGHNEGDADDSDLQENLEENSPEFLPDSQSDFSPNPSDESDPLDDARDFRDLLEEIGFEEGENFAYFEDAWGFHDEMSWGIRMDKILEFLFGVWR